MMKGSLSRQLNLERTYLVNVSTRQSSHPQDEWRRTRASSRNIGELSSYLINGYNPIPQLLLAFFPCTLHTNYEKTEREREQH